MQMIKQSLIKSVSDINRLGIVDWNRLNGYWDNDVVRPLGILNTWIVNHAQYTILEHDLTQYPQRDDWPGWQHQGNHERYGRLYWNMFHASFPGVGTLGFGDSPDFSGTLLPPCTVKKIQFMGDIGKVSGSTFIFSLMHMNTGDLWISLIDERTQVIIELFADVYKVFSHRLADMLGIR